MNRIAKLGLALSILGLMAVPALADGISPICVTNNNAAWALTFSTGPGPSCNGVSDSLLVAHYVLTEPGSEDIAEPVGDWTFNRTFLSGPGYATIHGVTDAISDYILFDNLGPGGAGHVQFFSDTAPVSLAGYTQVTPWRSRAEGATSGGFVDFFLPTDVPGESIVVAALSDGEVPIAGKYSDSISFDPVPEPSLLWATGALVGLAVAARHRTRAKALVGSLSNLQNHRHN